MTVVKNRTYVLAFELSSELSCCWCPCRHLRLEKTRFDGSYLPAAIICRAKNYDEIPSKKEYVNGELYLNEIERPLWCPIEEVAV